LHGSCRRIPHRATGSRATGTPWGAGPPPPMVRLRPISGGAEAEMDFQETQAADSSATHNDGDSSGPTAEEGICAPPLSTRQRLAGCPPFNRRIARTFGWKTIRE